MKKNWHGIFLRMPLMMFCVVMALLNGGCTKTYLPDTKEKSDNEAPTIISVDPENNINTVSLTAKPSVIFSEAMSVESLTSASFTVRRNNTDLQGAVAYSGKIATFSPSAPFEANTVYNCLITTSVKDIAGNALASNYAWTFTTSAATDVTAPTVQTVSPSNNAPAVPVSITPAVTFSESINPSTITASSYTLKQGTTLVAGTVSYSGTTATLTPSAALLGNTLYTVTVTGSVKDIAGNSLASNYTWSFTTAATVAAKSFSAEVVPVLNKCNTCHTHNWTPSSTPSIFHANLVSSGHINLTSPTNGRIYTKMSGGHPSSTVTAAEKTIVLTWIKEGSKNN